MPRSLTARRPATILDLCVLTALSALPMAAVEAMGTSPTWGFGRAQYAGTTLVVVLLAAGLVLWGISELASRAGDGWLSLLAIASMAAGGVGFLGVALVVFALNPYAAVLTLVAQTAAVLYVVFRP